MKLQLPYPGNACPLHAKCQHSSLTGQLQYNAPSKHYCPVSHIVRSFSTKPSRGKDKTEPTGRIKEQVVSKVVKQLKNKTGGHPKDRHVLTFKS